MAANIDFLAGSISVDNLSGSGLGFFGSAGFGNSIAVGSWQGTTYITDGLGVNQGPQCNNLQFINSGSGAVNGASSGTGCANIPNYLATLQIRFTYDTPVRVQNAKVYFYDRYSINNSPSGVTTKAIEHIHPSASQLDVGSGDSVWVTPGGSGVTLDLANSPGASGHFAGNGSNSTRVDTVHDWYTSISQSPNSIGSKTQNGLWVQLEYL
jgi:hypothetical protein